MLKWTQCIMGTGDTLPPAWSACQLYYRLARAQKFKVCAASELAMDYPDLLCHQHTQHAKHVATTDDGSYHPQHRSRHLALTGCLSKASSCSALGSKKGME